MINLTQFVTKQIDNYTQDFWISLSTSATSLCYSWKNSLLPLVSWFLCMKCLQAGLLYFYGEACLHLSGCINSPKEYKHGVLQTHVNCMIILCIRQNRFSVHSISKKNCGTIVLRRDSYSRKKLKSFDSIH